MVESTTKASYRYPLKKQVCRQPVHTAAWLLVVEHYWLPQHPTAGLFTAGGAFKKKISCRLATDRCEQQQTRAVTSNGPFPRKTRTPDHSPRSDLSRQGGPHFVPLLQSEGLGASAILTPPGALETDPAPFPGFEYVEYCQWIVVAKQYASTTACFSKCPTQCT